MATIINMPRLSPTMEEGVLAKWTKQAGDKISPGDVIAEVETDKANMDFPLEDEGTLLELLVPAGTTVKLGAPVAILGEPGEDTSGLKAGIGKAAGPQAANPQAANPQTANPQTANPQAANPQTANPQAAGPQAAGRVKASPLAKKIAADGGVDLSTLTGTGPGGRVIKRDVEAASTGKSATVFVARATGQDRIVPASPMRKTIARRLVEAKQTVPHFYLSAEATVDRLFDLRHELNEIAETKISVNDLIVKALALALVRIPDANVSWTDEGLLYHGRIDIGVAVSVADGLLTPMVRNADQKPLTVLSAEIKALAERAKQKKLAPEEYSGGSATVSNLGMFGVSEFKAIINPPESVILAVGQTQKRAIVVERNGKDEIVVAQRMALSLSCDHRVVDGVLGAKLLSEVVKILEKPASFLL